MPTDLDIRFAFCFHQIRSVPVRWIVQGPRTPCLTLWRLRCPCQAMRWCHLVTQISVVQVKLVSALWVTKSSGYSDYLIDNSADVMTFQLQKCLKLPESLNQPVKLMKVTWNTVKFTCEKRKILLDHLMQTSWWYRNVRK